MGLVWVNSVAIDCSVIGAGLDRVGAIESVDALDNSFQRCRGVGSEKAIWEAGGLEKTARDVEIQIARRVPTIDPKEDGETRLGVGRKVSWKCEQKLWVLSDRVLDTVESELLGGIEVIESISEFLAEGNQLRDMISFRIGVLINRNPDLLTSSNRVSLKV